MPEKQNVNRTQDLSLFSLPPKFRGRSAVTVQIWWLVQATLFALSPQFMYGWRRFLLKAFGAQIGQGVLLRPSVKVTYPWRLTIGDNSWVGDNVTLYTLGEIRIGENSVISQESYICTGSHDYSSIDFKIFTKPVSIGNGVWVASDVFIHPGVTIHDNAVIAARSTVASDAAPGYVHKGEPTSPTKPRHFHSD